MEVDTLGVSLLPDAFHGQLERHTAKVSPCRKLAVVAAPFFVATLFTALYVMFPVGAGASSGCDVSRCPTSQPCCVQFWLYVPQTLCVAPCVQAEPIVTTPHRTPCLSSLFDVVGAYLLCSCVMLTMPFGGGFAVRAGLSVLEAGVLGALLVWYHHRDPVDGHRMMRTLAPYPALVMNTLILGGYAVLVLRPKHAAFVRRKAQSVQHQVSLGDPQFSSAEATAEQRVLHLVCDDAAGAAPTSVRITRPPTVQVALALLCTYLLVSEFALLEFFAAMAVPESMVKEAGFYAAFLGSLYAVKAVHRACAFAVDTGVAGGGVSMYFIGEILFSTSYYLFYRVLFARVESWAEFVAIQVLHSAMEWVVYPGRTAEAYFNLTSQRSEPRCLRLLPKRLRRLLVTASQTQLTLEQWRAFLALDYALRLCILLFTAVNFIGWFTFLRFSYNSKVFRFFGAQSDFEYRRLCAFTAVSIVWEVVNAVAIHFLVFAHHGVPIVSRLYRLLSDTQFSMLATAALAPMAINVYLAEEVLVWAKT